MAAATSVPQTMRAWVFSSRGRPSQILRLTSSHPTPSAPTGKNVLVRVSHAALNPVGSTLMSSIPSIFGSTWGALEQDFCGTVVKAGPQAASAVSQPGTTVWGMKDVASQFKDHTGSLADYFLVSSDFIAPVPEGMKGEDAVGLALVGQTALGMLQVAKVKSGDRVLVNGASGGVGTMLVQIAKAKGLHVTATCSGANAEMVKGLGADEIVDYRTAEPSLPGFLVAECSDKPFDAILDCVGTQKLYESSPKYLKADHRFICIGQGDGMLSMGFNMMKNMLVPTFFGGTPRKWIFYNLAASSDKVRELGDLLGAKKIRVLVDSTYSMENAPDAYERLASHRAKGKVVIKVAE